jgi:hypothetical protein
MNFKKWLTKEIYIRLTEEGDGLVSTTTYSITGGPRFQRTVQFRTNEGSVSTYTEMMTPVRSGLKSSTRIFEI